MKLFGKGVEALHNQTRRYGVISTDTILFYRKVIYLQFCVESAILRIRY